MEAIAYDLGPRQAIPVDHILFVESGVPKLVNCMAWRGAKSKALASILAKPPLNVLINSTIY